MSGWATSRAFSDALTPSPCGCELERKAEKIRDPRDREAALDRATQCQRQWRCSKAGHPSAESKDELDPQAQIALQAVELLIDDELPPECPNAALSKPWVWQAVDHWYAWEKQQLVQIYGDLNSCQFEALKLVAQATNARQTWEIKNPPPKDDK